MKGSSGLTFHPRAILPIDGDDDNDWFCPQVSDTWWHVVTRSGT